MLHAPACYPIQVPQHAGRPGRAQLGFGHIRCQGLPTTDSAGRISEEFGASSQEFGVRTPTTQLDGTCSVSSACTGGRR
jgi:hypothetical protein